MKCIVTAVEGGKYKVFNKASEFIAVAKGNLKIKNGTIKVGDEVEISDGVITSIYERKTFFPRINVANIDCVNIVIAPEPTPDYLLVDKMLIECVRLGAKPYVTVNKCDFGEDIAKYVLENYPKACEKIFVVSAVTGEGVEQMKECFKGKIVAFAGQSAVGKTSLVNYLFGLNKRVNEVSEKLKRGRHTTTSRTLYVVGDFMIIDTPGFSSIVTSDIKSSEISHYYLDFEEFYNLCSFRDCTHTHEPDCAVKEALSEGKISKDRYERYLEIFKETKENEKRKY